MAPLHGQLCPQPAALSNSEIPIGHTCYEVLQCCAGCPRLCQQVCLVHLGLQGVELTSDACLGILQAVNLRLQSVPFLTCWYSETEVIGN